MNEINELDFTNRNIWAIQLSDSEFRTWEDKGKFSSLIFNWEKFEVPGTMNYSDSSYKK